MIFNFIKELQSMKSTFFRFFFYTIICLAFSLYYSCNKFERSNESKDYLKNPKIGDVYFLEKEDGNYTLLKIKDIGADSILFFINKIKNNPGAYMDGSTSSRKLDVVTHTNIYKFWTDSIQVISKDKIHSLYSKELIFEIKRN
jgi:hypothetical protein